MVTIKDIAREGGVSVSTVSRALAESPLLPKSTCIKIKEIANNIEEWGHKEYNKNVMEGERKHGEKICLFI